jgi:stage II sporulation protein D
VRRLTLPVVLLIALAFVASAPASPVFVLRGHGWGHGVGMSQYGALGKAQKSESYGQILDFYFPGTTIDGAPVGGSVRVQLTEGRSSITLSSASAFKIGKRLFSPNTAHTVVPTADGRVRVVGVRTFADGVKVTPGSRKLKLDGSRYRGAFKLWNGGGIEVVNVVALEQYLYAVVPREMPSYFDAAALRAQAVAARSYAARRMGSAGHFDLHDDTRDQVYGGLDTGGGEEATTTAAVKATAGRVVRYGGAVAQTFFSSSNGGQTAASGDTFVEDLPYLISKKDPDDLIPANPNRAWIVRLTPAQLAAKLGSSKRPTDGIVTQRASGRVAAIKLLQPSWSKTFTGGPEHFRFALGVRSSLFALGVLNIVPETTRTVCGGRLSLDVFARNMPKVSLQSRRSSGGTWVDRTAITTDRVTVVDKPCRGTTYRLHSSAGTGGNVAVQVSPQIAFRATQPAGGTGLRGFVKPVRLAGETVYVSRQRAGGGWHRVATATIKSDGTWRADFNAIEGSYRARVSPPASTGLVQGISAPFTLTLH